MKAVVVTAPGVQIQDVPTPTPKANEVLIRVRSCGLNRADLMVASGMAHGRAGGAGTIVGLEFVGEVAGLGAEAETESGLQIGDRVMCGGAQGWAEYAVADWGRAAKIPDANVSWNEAATLPTALNTMHNAVVTAGRMQAGESVLIQGASSGVGLMAQQIAKHKGAGLVIGTSTNAARRAKLTDFGADLALDSRDPTWADQVLEATNGDGVDLIVDNVSGYTVNDSLRCTKVLGRIVNVGRLGGFQGEFNFRPTCRPPHRLYRRHVPHALYSRGTRDCPTDAGRPWRRSSPRQAAHPHRQRLSLRAGHGGPRPHESKPAFRQDRA